MNIKCISYVCVHALEAFISVFLKSREAIWLSDTFVLSPWGVSLGRWEGEQNWGPDGSMGTKGWREFWGETEWVGE